MGAVVRHGHARRTGVGAHATVIEDLRAKYPQYAGHRLESRPVLRIEILGAKSWARSSRRG